MENRSRRPRMAQQGPAPASFLRRVRGWLLSAILRVFLPLAVVVAVVSFIANRYVDAQLQRELTRIRAAGQPAALSDLAKPRVGPTQNAAPIYIREARALSAVDQQMLSDFTSRRPDRRARVSRESVRRLLLQAEDNLARVRTAAALPACQFPVNWTAGAGAQFPHYADARRLARILRAHARLCAIDGRRSEAMADVAAILGIARHVGQEPVLLASLVEYAIIALARASLESVLTECSPSPSECRPVTAALSAMNLRTSFVSALEGERCFGLSLLECPSSLSPSAAPGGG